MARTTIKKHKTTYDFIDSNRRKTIMLVLLFPVVLFAMLALALAVVLSPGEFREVVGLLAGGVAAFSVIWLVVALFWGDDIIFHELGATKVSRRSHPELYRIVANLAITAGLPRPSVYVIDDPSLNAFATGRKPDTASICVTSGLLEALEKPELEGVVAHELSHIGNRDTLLMLIIVIFIGVCCFLGEVTIRSAARVRGGGKKKGNGQAILVMVGLALLLFGYIAAPLIRLAVSRRREYQADATAALMTRYPEGLIAALEKVGGKPHVKSLEKNEMMAGMCFANPLKHLGVLSAITGLASTHPPIEKRIAALRKM